jgi:hypothetical protein
MAKIEVREITAHITERDPKPRWYVIVSYEHSDEIAVPLSGREDQPQNDREALAAAENLGRALLDFVNRTRKQLPNDPD